MIDNLDWLTVGKLFAVAVAVGLELAAVETVRDVEADDMLLWETLNETEVEVVAALMNTAA